MTTFRFRAAVVLELRTRQEQQAATVLSRAEMALSQAHLQLAEAERARRTAQTAAVDRQRHGATSTEIEWHRNWITSLTSSVDQRRVDVELRQRGVHDAERAWRLARQRRLTIERMRDRAWIRFQRQQQREELKVIDELASLRYSAPDVWGESS
jgi:flagellar export protein FliJ